MAAAATKARENETTIYVPWDILDACKGFSFDIGGSVIKAVYIHRDDWREPSDRTKEKGALRLVHFSREDLDEALLYVKERTRTKRLSPDDVPLVYTTGVGCAQFLKEIRDTMKVITQNISEADCFIHAHRFMLEHQTQADLVHTTSEDTIKQVEKNVATWVGVVSNMGKKEGAQTGMAIPEKRENKPILSNTPDPEKTFMESDQDIFPNMLIMCGSAGAVIKVEGDGSFLSLDMMYRCGRMFLGLACMLTGAKTYEEVMELAEKGDSRNVHQNWGDLTKTIAKEDDSFYSDFTDHMDKEETNELFAFLFGKAVGQSRDQFRPEDLARALVMTVANDLAQTTSIITANPEVVTKDTFFCGNYVAHPLMRHYVTLEWGMRESMNAMFRKKEMRNLHFLKHGGHYGALGALLNHKLKFTDNMAAMQAKGAETFKETLGN